VPRLRSSLQLDLVWESIRLPTRNEGPSARVFVLGVPVFRQRFGRRERRKPGAVSTGCSVRAARREEQLRERFDGALERDETTFGGAAGKVIVFGVVSRNGHVKAMPDRRHTSLKVIARSRLTRARIAVLHDEWQAYCRRTYPGRARDDPQGEGVAARATHQRYRGLLELRQELAVSVTRRTHQILSSLPGRSLLAFQPSVTKTQNPC